MWEEEAVSEDTPGGKKSSHDFRRPEHHGQVGA
jgi:hypothetical protein